MLLLPNSVWKSRFCSYGARTRFLTFRGWRQILERPAARCEDLEGKIQFRGESLFLLHIWNKFFSAQNLWGSKKKLGGNFIRMPSVATGLILERFVIVFWSKYPCVSNLNRDSIFSNKYSLCLIHQTGISPSKAEATLARRYLARYRHPWLAFRQYTKWFASFQFVVYRCKTWCTCNV